MCRGNDGAEAQRRSARSRIVRFDVRLAAAAGVLLGLCGIAATARAAQHLYHINEVFTTADGSVQFIELVGEANGQGRFANLSLCAGDPTIPAGQPGRQCFRFTMNLADTQTAGRSLLFTSRAYADAASAQGLPAPDFVLEGPDIDASRPFFDPAGDQIDFLPEDARTDVVIFPKFPDDGVTSFNGPFTTRTNANMRRPMDFGLAPNSPTNFSGETGRIDGAAASADLDGDGIENALDLCPTVADRDQLDTDGDRVGDACDNCQLQFNPALAPSSGQTTTGGQIDDDADGFGNECDADFSQDGRVDARDIELFMSSMGKPALSSLCGAAGDESCARFDVFPGARVLDQQDLDAIEPLLDAAPGPKCERCPLECFGPNCGQR